MEFYRSKFDLEVAHDETLDKVAVRLVYLDAGPTMVQLVEPIGPGPINDHLIENGEGVHHLCFQVDDIGRFLDQNPEESVDVFVGGRGRPACFLTSTPNNVTIELVEVTHPSSG